MNKDNDLDNIDIDKISMNREKFNDFVYTPLSEAIIELNHRHCTFELGENIEKFLPREFLLTIKKNMCAILHRPLITDNYEVLHFLNATSAFNLNPIFLEYSTDKFVTRNEWKHALGHMGFYFGKGRKGGAKIEYFNSINFTQSDGKKLSEVNTLWGQKLSDFHHEMFLKRFPKLKLNIFDGLDWYTDKGGTPQTYYEPFFRLFICHGILFDNFLLNGEELFFTKKIILPALIKIRQETGIKPLIVALEPTENESDIFWMCHPPDMLTWIKKKSKI